MLRVGCHAAPAYAVALVVSQVEGSRSSLDLNFWGDEGILIALGMSSSSSCLLLLRSNFFIAITNVVVFFMFAVTASSLRTVSKTNALLSVSRYGLRRGPRIASVAMSSSDSSSGGGRASAAVEQSKGGKEKGGGRMDLTPPKGTRDFYPEDKRLNNWLFGKLCLSLNVNMIITLFMLCSRHFQGRCKEIQLRGVRLSSCRE